jgi:hypothetical protein
MTHTSQVIAEYIWLDSSNQYRAKTKIFTQGEIPEHKVMSLSSYPTWNYDGSSCGDNRGLEGLTECTLVPHVVYNDPFNQNTETIKYTLVLCRNYYYDYILKQDFDDTETLFMTNNEYNEILLKNNMYKLVPIHPDMEPSQYDTEFFQNQEFKLGFEQEFFMINPELKMPYGFKRNVTYCPFTFVLVQIFRHLGLTSGFSPISGGQGPYYCSVGKKCAVQRKYLKHTQSLLHAANINITGFNYEVAPGQAEFQVFGNALNACNDLLMLRYILQRNGENFGVVVSFDPVVIGKEHGHFNMSGCHTNISFNAYRELLFDEDKAQVDLEAFEKQYSSNNTTSSSEINETLNMNTTINNENDSTENLYTAEDYIASSGNTDAEGEETEVESDDDTVIQEQEQELEQEHEQENTNLDTPTTVRKFFKYVNYLFDIDFIDEEHTFDFNNIFGAGNTERCHGELETSNWREFSWGIGTRDTSVRIPLDSLKQNTNGNRNSNSMYYEDRRPASNVEPYTILNYWFNTANIIFNNLKTNNIKDLNDENMNSTQSTNQESLGLFSTAYNMFRGTSSSSTSTNKLD